MTISSLTKTLDCLNAAREQASKAAQTATESELEALARADDDCRAAERLIYRALEAVCEARRARREQEQQNDE